MGKYDGLPRRGKDNKEVQLPEWQPIMPDRVGQFIPLAEVVDGVTQLAPGSFYPPLSIYVEFALLSAPDVLLKGVVAGLSHMGQWRRSRTVFVELLPNDEQKVYSPNEVNRWREMTAYAEFSEPQLEYTWGRPAEVVSYEPDAKA